jgi:hypothetical protein
MIPRLPLPLLLLCVIAHADERFPDDNQESIAPLVNEGGSVFWTRRPRPVYNYMSRPVAVHDL